MGLVNEEYIERFIEAVEENYEYGIEELGKMIIEYESYSEIDSTDVKDFVINFMNSSTIYSDFDFFNIITTYGNSIGLSPEAVLDLAGLKGAYDILVSGCESGLEKIH